jgi:hypothetical protein
MITRLFIILILASAVGAAELAPAKRSSRFSYRRDDVPAGPWSIHIVKIDRANRNVELHTTLPAGNRFGLVKLSEQVKALGSASGKPLAAINGDYYETDEPYVGDPRGLQIMRGELISGPGDWRCFWIDGAGNPTMGQVGAEFEIEMPNRSKIPFGLNERRDDDGAVLYTSAVSTNTLTRGGTEFILERSGTNAWLPLRASTEIIARVAEVNANANSPTGTNRLVLSIGPKLMGRISAPQVGDVLRIKTTTKPSLSGVTTAIGGGPALVENGKALPRKEARVRHPRSAIAWNKQNIFLVEVDGRQPELSVGMTFQELGEYLVKMGCEEAMGLDGGGSATLWVGGQVMNNPCEGSERGMANGLVLVAKEAAKD